MHENVWARCKKPAKLCIISRAASEHLAVSRAMVSNVAAAQRFVDQRADFPKTSWYVFINGEEHRKQRGREFRSRLLMLTYSLLETLSTGKK